MTLGLTAVIIALEAWTSPGRIAAVLGFATLFAVVWWAWGNGWRFRNPLHRLPPPKRRSPREEAEREGLRRLRSDLASLYHARLLPAAEAFKGMTAYTVGQLESHSPGAALAGQLLSAYAVNALDSAARDLRWALESHWGPEHAAVRELALEWDLDKKSPDDFGFLTFILYAHYNNLIGWTEHAAAICCGKLSDLPGYGEWKRLDEHLKDRLREIFASPELESYRADLEEAFKR